MKLCRLLYKYCRVPVLLIVWLFQSVERQVELVYSLEYINAYTVKCRARFPGICTSTFLETPAFIA